MGKNVPQNTVINLNSKDMKTSYLCKIVLLAVFAFAWAGCSSDSGGTAFIPGFNATWAVEGTNGEYRIDLQPNEANKNVPSGVFEGEEQNDNDPALDGNPLSGSFNGLDIEFTIVRDPLDTHKNVRYKGKMEPTSDTNNRIIKINLTSSKGNLVLVPL